MVLSKDGASPIPPESDDEKVKDADKKDDKDTKDDKDKKDAKDKKDDSAKKSDDKKDADKKDADKKDDKDKPVEVKIDLDKIGDRILSLPIPARNYAGLTTGKTGVLFLAETSPFGRGSSDGAESAPSKFTLEKRKTESVLTDLNAFVVAFDGSKVLYGAKGATALFRG